MPRTPGHEPHPLLPGNRRRCSVPAQSKIRGVVRAAVVTLLVAGDAWGQGRAAAPPPSLDSLSKAFEELSRRVSPSIVQVVVTGYGTPKEASSADALLGLRRTGGSRVILRSPRFLLSHSH